MKGKRKMKKKIFIILLVLFIVLTMSFGVWAAKVIRLGHTLPADTGIYQPGALRFKELVEERTNGEIEVMIYPQSQLGWEFDMLEGMQLGTIDMCISASGAFVAFVPELGLLEFPFLFKNTDHIHWFFYESEAKKELIKNADPESKGFKILALGGGGFRFPWTDKSINKPSDFKGLKIRLMAVPLHRDTYLSMGADVTSVAWAELYGALQMGVVDGAEGTYSNCLSMAFQEVTDWINELPVFTGADFLIMSKLTYDSLTPEQQKIVEEAGVEAWKYHDEVIVQMEKESKEKILQYGIKINEDINLQPFIDAVQPVYKKYLADYPEWAADMVKNIQEEGKKF